MEETVQKKSFRSAIVALVGRPNSGKSTLLNTIIGEEVSIATPLPQTTRLAMRGIYTTDTMQLVFVDTPGLHQGKHQLNHAMLREAKRAIAEGIDVLCYLVDISRDFREEEAFAAELVLSVKNIPVMILFNKADIVDNPESCIKKFYRLFPLLERLPSIVISARSKNAKEIFLAAIDTFIPEGPAYFDCENLTDSTMRSIAAEFIRKHIIAAVSREVPHAVFVEIESYRETGERHVIEATIHVETNGQRGIIIGKGGAVLERIRKGARADIARLAEMPVSLSCHVKVSPKWRDNAGFLRRGGMGGV